MLPSSILKMVFKYLNFEFIKYYILVFKNIEQIKLVFTY